MSRPAAENKLWINLLFAIAFLPLMMSCGGERAATPAAGQSSAPTETATAVTPAPAVTADADFDLQFIDAMRPHHEMAVEMAKMAATRGADPKIRGMASKMVDDQTKETAQLAEWRKLWYGDAPLADVSKLEGSSSMKMDMGHMQSMSGKDLDLMFAEMMVPHHEGAVTMACQAHGRASHPEIKEFARSVIRAQEAEISELQVWKQKAKM